MKKHPDWISKDVWKREPVAKINGKKIWEISVDGSGWTEYVDEYGRNYEKEINVKYKKRKGE